MFEKPTKIKEEEKRERGERGSEKKFEIFEDRVLQAF